MLFQKHKIICLLCLQIITIMPRDMDPNVFQFELICLICQAVEHSQGNLKCHFKERGCRKFLVSCGCCGIVYDSAHALASHLNARGTVGRDSFYPPGLAVSIDTAVADLFPASSPVVNLSSPYHPPSTAPAALGRLRVLKSSSEPTMQTAEQLRAVPAVPTASASGHIRTRHRRLSMEMSSVLIHQIREARLLYHNMACCFITYMAVTD